MLRTQLALGALAVLLCCQAAGAADEDYDPLLDEDFEEELDDGSQADPLEGMNRGIFAFNRFLDECVPVAAAGAAA